MPHFLLRLDDGTIIADGSKLQGAGSSGPVMLNAETAYQLGLLKDVHVARLEKLLVELHSKVPNAGPLRSLPSHGQNGNAGVDHQPATQDALRDAHHGNRGIQRFDSGSPPAGSGANSWGAPPADFTDKCREILDQTRAKLASDIFDFPVNAALVADYYTIIHHPMDFSNVRKKLDTRTYSNPQEYYEDMKLIWENCYIYNGKPQVGKPASVVGKIGQRFEDIFEPLWAGSGFAQDVRHRRTTAGVMPSKYEPQHGLLEKPKIKKQASMGNKGMPRQNSVKPWSRGRMQEVADAIQTICSTDQSALEDVLAIVRKRESNLSSNNDEVELDFERMSFETLAELEQFARRLRPSQQQNFYSDDDGSESDDD